MAKAIANEVKNATFFQIHAMDIFDRSDRESKANVDAVFQLAKIFAPSIIFIGNVITVRHRGKVSLYYFDGPKENIQELPSDIPPLDHYHL